MATGTEFITINRTRMRNYSARGMRPEYIYRATGTDGTPFENWSVREITRVLRRYYPNAEIGRSW